MSKYVQGSLFEEDYLIRSLGAIAYRDDIAITELVANAWDAGASRVNITLPDDNKNKLIIEDDGIGLSSDEFHHRWMRLGYNRQKHQGVKVVFPPGRTGNRLPYGKNGIGRHGLLCFNNNYKVVSKKDGKQIVFDISTRDGNNPFVLEKESAPVKKQGHGTRLEVSVERNRPKHDKILDIISARFLHDPQFEVRINGESVQLENHQGLVESATLQINENIKLDVLFIDTQKAARSTIYQGIAFWQGGRLVGEPSWILGKNSVIDGRTRFAKRYTFVAKTEDLADFVTKDWTGFIEHQVMDDVYEKLADYVQNAFRKLSKNQIDETKLAIRDEFKKDYSELSPLGQYEVNEVIDHLVDRYPTTNQETIGIAVEAVIRLEKTRTGKELIHKLSQLSDEDVTGLNRLLDQWTVKDALSVLDEIDRRMSVIEAISKLSGDPKIDELQVLHPLVTEARWLFGPEFDSAEYTSNQQLQTIIKRIFKKKLKENAFENKKKRPDLFMLTGSTASITGAEQTNIETGMLEMGRILIIELKRGGSNLTRDNRNQALGYVEDFINCRELTGNPQIFAFVVGETISGKVTGKQSVGDTGHVYVTTFSQIVDTARQRLFNLKRKLTDRYDGVSGVELVEKFKQMDLNFEK